MKCVYWDGIGLYVNPATFSTIIAYKCPICLQIADETLKEWKPSEIENIKSIKEELETIVKSWSPAHHKEFHQVSKICIESGAETECWCDPSLLELKHIQVSLLTECNLHCRFCGAKKIRDGVKRCGLSQTYHKINFDFLNKLKNLNLDYIRLTDYGEPFFFYKETLNWISQLTTSDTKKLLITTNATLLQNDCFELIEQKIKEGIDIKIHVSLNAYSPESYIKKVKSDYFYKVLKNIFKLSKIGCLDHVSFLIDDVSDIENYKNFLVFLSSLGINCQVYPDNNNIDKILQCDVMQELLKLY